MTHQIHLGAIFALTVAVSCSPSNTPDTQSTSPSASAVTANDFALFSWHRRGRHTGGATSTGGTTSAGGAMSTGGLTSSGGTTSTGGGSTGGAMSAGGSSSTGGVSTGGVISAGGSSNTGGPSTGGVMSAGGSSGTGGAVATGGTGTSGLFQNGFFLIGTFMPTINEFATWHGRGVNTGVGPNSYTDPSAGRTLQVAMQDWDAKARTQGMRTIRNPMPNPADDVGNTTLLAWDQMDEPQASGAGLRNLASCVANYQQWKAVDPSRPVFLNFAGVDAAGAITGPKPSWCTDATGGCSLAWVSNDVYPCSGYLPDESRRCDPTYVGDPIDRIRSWTDKPQFAFIETSNQRFVPQSTRGPTKDEVRAEIWVAIVHGVRGYFAAHRN